MLGAAQIPARITVDPAQHFQVMAGFGVNFNGTYFREAQKPLLDRLIDDLGATIFRLDPYGKVNWETRNDNDDPNAMNWEYYNDRYSSPAFEASWAAARYLNGRGIRPLLALSGAPPAWMLDPKDPNHLNPAMYEEFAETLVSLAAYARFKARIEFEYFGPMNENDCPPIEGPGVSPREMPLVLKAIARRLNKEGLGDLKLVAVDQCHEKNDYVSPLLADPELMKQIGIFSFHAYGSASFASHVEKIRRESPRPVPIWLTEYGDLNDRDFTAENEWKSFCLTATRRALNAINEGMSAALFWDAYDNFHDHDQRITYYGLVRNTDHIYSPKKRYYAAKQLYHFVKPGARRIAASSDAEGLTVSAFRDANSVVIVLVKEGGSNHIRLELPAEAAPASWRIIETTIDLDSQETGAVTARNGVAEINLPDQAVVTLVGALK